MQQTGYPVKEKGLLMLAGQPLVAWVDKAFPATIRARYISANRCETGYQPYGQVIQDAPDLPSAAGPLVGLASSARVIDRKSTRLNFSHVAISYALLCLKK